MIYKKPKKRATEHKTYNIDILNWQLVNYKQRLDRGAITTLEVNSYYLTKRDKVEFKCSHCNKLYETGSAEFVKNNCEKICLICRKSKPRIEHDLSQIKRMYFDEKMSLHEISSVLGFSKQILSKWLAKDGNKLRTVSEGNRLVFEKRPELKDIPKRKEVRAKIKQSFIEKYGVDHPTKTKEVKEKRVKTFIEKFGVENPFQSEPVKEKIKSSNRKKYGTNYPMQDLDIKNKSIETCLEKYGAPTFNQSEAYQKAKDEIKSKAVETKRRNGTFNTSIPEGRAFDKLIQIYNKVERQYRDNRYPSACDFYISDEDLFIECNYHWTHGGEPFKEDNEEHQKIKEKWTNKNTDYFNQALKTWTKRDPKKTNFAQKNNLNYSIIWDKEIFDMDNTDLTKSLIKMFALKEFNFMDIVLTKNQLLSSSLEDLERLIPIIRRWCRLFFPEFVIDYAVDPLPKIYKQVTNKRDFWAHPHSGFNPGNLFLKNRFMSFWKGVRGHKISVAEAYYDDAILDKILRYRLGLNAKRETFDISMRHIIRGFISGGYSISWFAPVIAYEIYKKYAVGCKTMYDPCAGFGARQLAWKAFGGLEYYGVDANPETVLENQKLMKEIGLNGKIYCDYAEKFNLDHKVDFAFTCPPYFNAENYSKPLLNYSNTITDFLYPLIDNTLAVTNKFVIVVNKEMAEAIEEGYNVKEKHLIGNTASHLTGRRNYEYILVF